MESINEIIIKKEKEKMSKYKVFYNKDCAKYGVLRFGNIMNDCMGDRWQQVTLKDKPAYTKYSGVAKRWMEKLKKIYK